MKAITIIMMALALIITAISLDARESRPRRLHGEGGDYHDELLASMPLQDLNTDETSNLLFMREEEKLARDVYLTLYEQWNLPAFRNIARSEQRHYEMVGTLLERYQLEDPSTDDRGVFSEASLKKLYDELVQRGKTSLREAIQVGVMIEEKDIVDLDAAIQATDNEDIRMVLGNLRRASENHLRAFNGHAARYE